MAVRKWQGQDQPATCDAGFRYIPGLQVVDPEWKWESNRCKPRRTTSSWVIPLPVAGPSETLPAGRRHGNGVEDGLLPYAWPVDVTRPGWDELSKRIFPMKALSLLCSPKANPPGRRRRFQPDPGM